MIHPYAYYLGRAARWSPERIAVIEGEARLTYREIDQRASALARALIHLGVKPGDRVAVLQANNHEFMEALVGAARAGAAFVPILGMLTETDHAYVVQDCGARVLIAPVAALGARARVLKERVPGVAHVIAVGGVEGALDYEQLPTTHAGEAPVIRGKEGDLGQILYTSGTTGKPKGVVHTFATTQAAMFAWVEIARRQPGDVGLLYTPMSHFAARLMDSGWVAGSTAVILQAPDPVQTFAAIERHRVTHLLRIPTLLQMFLGHPEIDRHDLSSLRFIFYPPQPPAAARRPLASRRAAAAPASSALVRRAIERFGSILHTGWGGTEAYGLNTHMTPAQHQAAIEGHEAALLSR